MLRKPVDPANFRRQLEKSLIDTGQRMTGARHRPPRLYRYDSTVAMTDNGPLTTRIGA